MKYRNTRKYHQIDVYIYKCEQDIRKYFQRKYTYQIQNMASQRQNTVLSLLSRINFLKLRVQGQSIQVHTKLHYTILQFLVVTYDMGFLHCAIDLV